MCSPKTLHLILILQTFRFQDEEVSESLRWQKDNKLVKKYSKDS